MGIVITCPGAFTSYNTGNFQGTLFSSNTVVSQPLAGESWNNSSLSNSSAEEDVTDMDALISNYLPSVGAGERLIVAGHSRGGQIVYKWLRQKGPTSLFDPAKLLFISSGNPERFYNGASSVHYSGHGPTYPGTEPYGNGYGIPFDTPFRVLDISRQYDEYADHPHTDDSTPQRTLTVDAGVHSAYSACPELGADGFPTNWDEWTYWDTGNITWLVSPFFPHPSTPAQAAKSSLATVFPIIGRREDQHYGYVNLVYAAGDERFFNRLKPIQPPPPYREG